MNRKYKLALMASMALNIWGISYYAGQLWQSHQPAPEFAPRDRVGGLARFLPEAERTELQSRLEPKLEAIGATRKDIRAQRAALHRLLAEDTPDKQAVLATFANMRALYAKNQEIFQAEFADSLLSMSKESRLRVVEAMQQRYPLENTDNNK